jgi:hypothetical protein
MQWNNQTLRIVMLSLASCSGELREKPQLDCKPGADPNAVACSDGIIGSCAGGSPQYAVCSDISVCQASWQQAGAYKCSQDSTSADAGLLMYVRGSSNAYLQGVALRVAGDGNADGILAAGEAGTLSIELRNASESIIRSVTGLLSTSQPGVTITSGAELYFGDLDSGTSACGSASPALAGDCSNFSALTKVELADNISIGLVDFELTVRDAESNSVTLTFELTLDPLEQL